MSSIRKKEIDKYNEKLKYYLDEDDKITASDRLEISKAISALENWSEKYEDGDVRFSHRASNELEMEIMSVNGNTDRKYIHEYVTTMPIRDASSVRKYIARNTPGVDYNFEIEKPKSLGGGSMKVFLQFDQFIFFTDTD